MYALRNKIHGQYLSGFWKNPDKMVFIYVAIPSFRDHATIKNFIKTLILSKEFKELDNMEIVKFQHIEITCPVKIKTLRNKLEQEIMVSTLTKGTDSE